VACFHILTSTISVHLSSPPSRSSRKATMKRKRKIRCDPRFTFRSRRSQQQSSQLTRRTIRTTLQTLFRFHFKESHSRGPHPGKPSARITFASDYLLPPILLAGSLWVPLTMLLIYKYIRSCCTDAWLLIRSRSLESGNGGNRTILHGEHS
jgi:hypothetical protein